MTGGSGLRAWMAAPLLAAGLLAGCGGGGDVEVQTVELRVADKANQDSPVPVDLVLVGNETLVAPVLELTAADWFRKRDQFQRDYPDTIKVYSWELVPGQVVPRHEISRLDNLWAAVVFAYYGSEGAHRLRVDGHTDLTLRLGEEDVDVVQTAK